LLKPKQNWLLVAIFFIDFLLKILLRYNLKTCIMKFIIEGGPLFMVTLLIFLIVLIILFITGLKDNTEKTHKLINSLALFSFVFGVLGFVIGLLQALEVISIANSVSNQVLAAGFRVGLLAPAFGMIIFLIGKLFTIILTWRKK
jgi:hypothetical protein